MLERLNAQSTMVKLLVMLVIAGLIGGLGYYFVVMGMIDANKLTAETLDKKEKENAELRQFVTRLSDLDRQITLLKAQMEAQKQVVPDEKNADTFIIMLQEQAANSGINIRRLEARPVANREYYTEVPFGLTLDGPYYGVMTFFDKLSGQTRIVNVSDLTMKSLANKAGVVTSQFPVGPNDSVSVTATAKTFFSREATATPAPAGKTK
ncbi:MAG: type 4a pilus biogenesis protein PilO [Acidobacteriales bacterium]|nr:type 4a pilus biogenesis protein PilO [Terriglobales bacterium]